MPPLVRSIRLAEILTWYFAEIRDDWAGHVRADATSHYAARSFEEVSTWAGRGLTAVRLALSSGEREPIEAYVRRLVRVRRRLGFDIAEVIRGLLALKRVALPHVVEGRRPADPPLAEMIAAFDTCVEEVVAEFGGQFHRVVGERIERERLRTVRMLEAVELVTATLGMDSVLDRAASRIRSAVDADFCAVLLRDESGAIFVPRASDGEPRRPNLRPLLDEPVDGEQAPGLAAVLETATAAVLRGNDVFPHDPRESCASLGLRELIVLPIEARGRVAALALAARDAEREPLESNQLRLAQGIASAVGPAIDNARLHASLRRRFGESKTLHQISSSLLEEGSLADTLDLVCRECRRLVDADGASVLLRAEETGWTTAAAVGRAATEGQRLALQLLLPAAGTEPVEPVVLDDATTIPGRRATGGNSAAMPLRIGDEVVGVLQVVRVGERFDEDSLRLLARIANQAAIAIEHQRLHDRHEESRVVEERHRLSRELHDSVSQSLYGVMMFAEAAARLVGRRETEAATAYLKQLREAAQQALWEMRLLIFELHPLDLRGQGLEAALQARLSTVESRAGLSTEFRCDDVGELPANVEQAVYRVAQEALSNAIRHAHATRVSIRVSRSDGEIRLVFEDDGVGFCLDSASRKGGLGLDGMRERAAALDGRIEIRSRPGEGVRIELLVPLAGAGPGQAAAPPVVEVTG